MMKMRTALLGAVSALTLLTLTACQTLTSARFHSEVSVVLQAQANSYRANFKISETANGMNHVLATPTVVFQAGQPAKVRVENGSRVITAEAYVPSDGPDAICLVKTRVHEGTRQIFHHSEVVKPRADK